MPGAGHPLPAGSLDRLLELDADGKIVWEHKPASIAVIFQILPNGNILYAYGGKPTGVLRELQASVTTHTSNSSSIRSSAVCTVAMYRRWRCSSVRMVRSRTGWSHYWHPRRW